MAALNKLLKKQHVTHEGAPAKHLTSEQQLRRSVMASMLWENQFYEDGISIAERVTAICENLDDEIIASIAVEARDKQHLRHMPLLLARTLAGKGSKNTADTLYRIIQRPDELTEYLAIYWKDGKVPISKQSKKGLAAALGKMGEYQLAKYNRDGAVKLKDVLFMTHAKPKDQDQAELWRRLVNDELQVPDTWEVALSGGADKRQTFERLISENKLGAMAFLRNLRNMIQSGIDPDFIRAGLKQLNAARVLPFRFIAAARYAPMLEPDLEKLMIRCIEDAPKLTGKTILLIDVSGSMEAPVSDRSDLTRLDAASALAVLAREICDDVRIFTFSDKVVEVPLRRGFALTDAIKNSQDHSGTRLGEAVESINKFKVDRIIVISDEQSCSAVPDPQAKKAYMINVASYENGIGYGRWLHVDGWSEGVVDYITEYEKSL